MFPLRLVSGISQITGTGDGDFGDRLNHRYTPILLILFAILVSPFLKSTNIYNTGLVKIE